MNESFKKRESIAQRDTSPSRTSPFKTSPRLGSLPPPRDYGTSWPWQTILLLSSMGAAESGRGCLASCYLGASREGVRDDGGGPWEGVRLRVEGVRERSWDIGMPGSGPR
jgi:hypothetical protein